MGLRGEGIVGTLDSNKHWLYVKTKYTDNDILLRQYNLIRQIFLTCQLRCSNVGMTVDFNLNLVLL